MKKRFEIEWKHNENLVNAQTIEDWLNTFDETEKLNIKVTEVNPDECVIKAWRYCYDNAKEQGGYEPATEEEINWIQVGVNFMRDKCLEIIEAKGG